MAFKYRYPHNDTELMANRWEEISEKEYHDLLGAVPPIRRSGPAFMVGECLCSMNDGREVYMVCVKVDGKYFKRPVPIDSFLPDAFIVAVRQERHAGDLTFNAMFQDIPPCMVGGGADDARTVEDLVGLCKLQLDLIEEGQDGTEDDDPEAIKAWLKKWDR